MDFLTQTLTKTYVVFIAKAMVKPTINSMPQVVLGNVYERV